ncbi:MAG: hypothetical protein C4532_07205 [Candidatus Abyssobacteria bacterium SURF_17]|uniref:Uncharacterized protein n=1 Tax=Candidatus Abyssobacteria bacterium SURF_17 TaxID=2093361 RepID=A0A419F0V2_9BACT|nr:MAG: hypothetical protein C4532_07205 [Candidatus Abyssubacteria bacterium SURF_17]
MEAKKILATLVLAALLVPDLLFRYDFRAGVAANEVMTREILAHNNVRRITYAQPEIPAQVELRTTWENWNVTIALVNTESGALSRTAVEPIHIPY